MRTSATSLKAVNGGQMTISTFWTPDKPRLRSVTCCTASLIVLLSFQLPAIIGFLEDRFKILFILQSDDSRKRLAFKIFERGSAAGRNMRHFIFQTKSDNARGRITATDDSSGVL